VSKASEWAAQFRAMRDATPARFRDKRRGTDKSGPYLDCEVGTDGTASVRVNDQWVATLEPANAIAFAQWLLDTFGETP